MLSDSFSALATGGPGSGHSRNPGPYLNVTLLYRWTHFATRPTRHHAYSRGQGRPQAARRAWP